MKKQRKEGNRLKPQANPTATNNGILPKIIVFFVFLFILLAVIGSFRSRTSHQQSPTPSAATMETNLGLPITVQINGQTAHLGVDTGWGTEVGLCRKAVDQLGVKILPTADAILAGSFYTEEFELKLASAKSPPIRTSAL